MVVAGPVAGEIYFGTVCASRKRKPWTGELPASPNRKDEIQLGERQLR